MKRTCKLLGGLLVAFGVLSGCGGESGSLTGPGSTLRIVAFSTDQAGDLNVVVFDFEAGAFRTTADLNAATGADVNPDLTPDGSKLVHQSDRPGGEGGSDLYQYDLDNTMPLDSLTLNTPFDETEPAWTGDGSQIAFVRDTLGFKRIRLFDVAAQAYVPLPGLDSMATYNDWAPAANQDGSLIAFVSDRSGEPHVYIYDSMLSGLRSYAALLSDSTATEPSLTPTGQWLAYAAKRVGGQGGYDVYLLNLITGSLAVPNASLNSPADDRNPSIAESGGVLSFESDRPNGIGMIDIWNHDRFTGATGQAQDQSSVLDDLQPSLSWR